MFVSRHSPSSYHHNSQRYTECCYRGRGRDKTRANISVTNWMIFITIKIEAQNQWSNCLKGVLLPNLRMSLNCTIFFIFEASLKMGYRKNIQHWDPKKTEYCTFKKWFWCNIQDGYLQKYFSNLQVTFFGSRKKPYVILLNKVVNTFLLCHHEKSFNKIWIPALLNWHHKINNKGRMYRISILNNYPNS